MMRRYRVKITPGVGGKPIWVETVANDSPQARKLIIAAYAPKAWWSNLTLLK